MPSNAAMSRCASGRTPFSVQGRPDLRGAAEGPQDLTSCLRVLYRGGVVAPPKHVQLRSARRLVIETEVALVVGNRSRRPCATWTSCARTSAWSPRPSNSRKWLCGHEGDHVGRYYRRQRGAHQVIVGTPAVQGVGWLPPLKDVRVALSRNGVVVSEGRGADVAGDPWQAGFWLANKVVEQGVKIDAGQVLYTGAMGKMVAATNGSISPTTVSSG